MGYQHLKMVIIPPSTVGLTKRDKNVLGSAILVLTRSLMNLLNPERKNEFFNHPIDTVVNKLMPDVHTENC
jgi:hypothetical protein